ncbi:GNAT family N-acetyltransferase [Verrucomicrobia bacterium]|nr:GNAT family N-acetyltransferase [Verrucomicrobiota bacterium]
MDLERDDISWFVSQIKDEPVGVLRVMYNPPLELYKEYGFKQLDSGLDVEAFVNENKIAEIGRFAVLPEYRRYIVVVAALMRAASQETVEREYSHYVTDIFEGEKHSPYEFHTRVMGFKPVATHDVGELNCPNRRITMILDIHEAYNRIRKKQKWIFRFLTKGWSDELHSKLLDRD